MDSHQEGASAVLTFHVERAILIRPQRWLAITSDSLCALGKD
jgi:hypothetical protein